MTVSGRQTAPDTGVCNVCRDRLLFCEFRRLPERMDRQVRTISLDRGSPQTHSFTLNCGIVLADFVKTMIG